MTTTRSQNELLLATLKKPALAKAPADPSDTVKWHGCETRRTLAVFRPTICKKYLDFNNYEGQRALVQSRVDMLGDKMLKSLYHSAAIAIAIFKRMRILINGQHSLKASVQSSRAINVFLEEFYITDKKDLSLLFAQFDNGGIRNAGHVAVAYAYDHGLMLDAPTIGRLSSSMAIARWGVDKWSKSSKEDRAQNMVDNLDKARLLAKIIDPERSCDDIRFITRSQVIAAMYQSMQKNVAESNTFWVGVRDANNLENGCPQLSLHKWLNQHSSNTRDVSRRVSNHLLYAQCIEAWNAYRNDRKMRRLSRDTKVSALAD